MRVAFVAQPFDRLHPPVGGGSLAIWIYQIARICARLGHKTTVFANHGSNFRANKVHHEGVDYLHTPTGLNRLRNKLSRIVRRSGSSSRSKLPRFVFEDLSYAADAARRAARLNCDVVHVMNYFQFLPVIRRLHPRARIALHMQCEWLTQMDRGEIEKQVECADLIIGCSEYITRLIIERFPGWKSRCHTVPNAASALEACDRTAESSDCVLFVGRVSPEKGVHLLIEAFHEVLKRFPDARLHLVGGLGSAPYEMLVGLSEDPKVAALRVFYNGASSGSDPYVSHVQGAAGKELGKRIFFEGHIDHRRTVDFYRRAGVLVNPSLSESFGMTLVEAMMHRVPVVASRVGGMPYIVEPGVTGLLVEPARVDDLAAAICEVLGDRQRASQMGVAGRERVLAKFTWEKAADRLIESFATVLH